MGKTDRLNFKNYSRLFATGAAFIALVAIAPAAQAGSLGNGHQQRIQAAVNRCLAMPHGEMMKDSGCKSLRDQHPELFSGGGMRPQTPPH